MNEFNLDNNIELGTSVSKLQNIRNKQLNDKENNNDLKDLIKDLENRLDNLEESNPIDSVQVSNESRKKKNKPKINNNTIKYSELIIYMIIFILLNNKITVTIIHNLPYFNKSLNPYPNLILRTLLFGLIIYLYKRFIK